MGLFSGIAIFFTIWWTVLFMVLPWGVQSHADAGIKVPGGGEPGSPVNPKLKQKFLITTAISVVLFAILWGVLTFGLIKLPPLR
jgi:predicted secreted protein